MEFFIDSADISEIREMKALNLADGVTTNPSLIKKSGLSREEVAHNICEIIDGPVSIEVIATEYEGMIQEAKDLKDIARNICIKVPATSDGLRACRMIREQGAEVNVTLCFSANQALLAARAGASFVSPFVGRMDDINLDGIELLADIQKIYQNFNFKTKILAASIRNVNHIKRAALLGIDVITAPSSVLKELIQHPLTEKGLHQFMNDFKMSATSKK